MPAAGRAVDLSSFVANRTQRRAMVAGSRAGTAKDVLLTEVPRSPMIWLGIANGGAVKLTPEETHELAASLDELADRQERRLRAAIEGQSS